MNLQLQDKRALITGSTSGNASHPLGNQGAYSASKAAVLNLSISLANALAKTGVTSRLQMLFGE